MRQFASGSTRGGDEDKLDYEGYLSPLSLKAYACFVHNHRIQEDGKRRASDNWQKGIPISVYMKSMWRHFMDAWSIHRGWSDADIKEALCAVIFNAQGYLHEILKKERLKKGSVTYTDKDGITYAMINVTQNSPMPKLPPETQSEWLEYQSNMTAASLPFEDDGSDLQLKER